MADDAPVLKAGDEVDGAYVIEAFVAGGGMGQVYVARDLRLDRRVALKLMHATVAATPDGFARFTREAHALSRVVHPNVVSIHAFGRHGDASYLVMEYVEGDSLDRYLLRAGRLELPETLRITRQIAAGLAESHALGIVHRDVKPANILMRRLAAGDLLAKVVDFGLARTETDTVHNLAMGADIVGTPLYMSPEQIQGAVLDGRSDLYALATVVFQLLTGRAPFARDTVQATLQAHLQADPPTLAVPGVAWELPPGIELEIRRALAKDRNDRHPDVMAFVAALEGALQAEVAVTQEAATACPTCNDPTPRAGGYCMACGSAVPLAACPACATPRYGERYACVSCGTALVSSGNRVQPDATQQGGSGLGMSARMTAILVAKLDPSAAIGADVGETMAFLASVVEREGGRLVAVVGLDAIAAFGLGGMREREVEAAVDAGICLLTAPSATMSRSLQSIRIGVAVGPVRSVGLGTAWGSSLVVGSAVDVARAAATAAEFGTVALDATAWREVRGVYETLAAWGALTLVRRRRARSRALADYVAHRADAALVARKTELELLERSAQRAWRGNALVAVPVIGPAGSGKTRLVIELLQRLESSGQPWHVDVGKCSSLGTPAAYEPLVEVLQIRARLDEVSPEAAERAIAALPGLADAALPEQVLRRRVRAIARLVGIARDDETESSPASDVQQKSAFEAVASVIRAGCREKPAVLVLENLQWAKQQTLELIAHLVRSCADVPLLLVPLVRTEQAEAVLQALQLPAARTVTVEVGPLSPRNLGRLVTALCPGVKLSATVLEPLHGWTAGLPAQVEEAVDALRTDCLLQAGPGGKWTTAGETQLVEAIGGSLSDHLLRQFHRAPPAERSLAEVVAMAAHQAPCGLLEAMLGRPVSDAELEAGKRAGMLVQERTGGFAGHRSFSLRHPRLGSVIRESLPAARTTELHRRAARWLLDWNGVRPAGFGSMLAHHLRVAGDQEAAAQCLLQNARDAVRAMANRDAFDIFLAAAEVARESLERSPGQEQALAVAVSALVGRAELGLRLGELAEGIAAASQALTLAGQGSALAMWRVRARILLGEAHFRSGNGDAATEILRQAAQEAAGVDEGDAWEARALYLMAMILVPKGDHDAVEALSRAALERFESRDAVSLELHRSLGRLHTGLGHSRARRKDLVDAERHYCAAREHFIAAGDDVAVAMTDLSLGNLAYRAGDLEGAAARYRQTADACRALDDVQGEAMARANHGNVLLDQQQPELALSHLGEAERMLRRAGTVNLLPEVLRLITVGRLAVYDAAGAREAAQEAIVIATQIGDQAQVAACRALLDAAQETTEVMSGPTMVASDTYTAIRKA